MWASKRHTVASAGVIHKHRKSVYDDSASRCDQGARPLPVFRRDPGVLRMPLRIPSGVARGGDDHDAGVNRALRGERQRIVVVGLVYPGRHGQVHNADVQLCLVRDDVAKRRNHG